MAYFEHVVAQALRLEHNVHTNETVLIFKITDEKFKQKMIHNFSENIELILREKEIKCP